MTERNVVADSSFFLCFLEDIQNPKQLLSLTDCFDFLMTTKVFQEVSKSRTFQSIGGLPKVNTRPIDFDITELLKPFFTPNQVIKGETEAIALSFYLFESKLLYKLILDDHQPREFVERNYKELATLMTGTLGFIRLCCCELGYLTRHDSLDLLNSIEKSNFWADSNILITVRKQIESLTRIGTSH